MELPFVSIIIPTYHDWYRLSLCLSALASQSYSLHRFEVIVVNNDPKDLTPKDFLLPNNTIIINESKPGSYAARNAALRIAKGNIIGFTDSDCIPDLNWILSAVEFLTNRNDLYRIGGSIALFCKGSKPNIGEIYDFVFAFPQKGYVEDMGWSVTANMFVKREIFDSVGNFNDNLTSGGDHEWGKRATTKGYKIEYCVNSIIRHPARDSVKELLIKSKRTSIGSSDIAFSMGIVNPSLLKQIYTIFRFRTDELDVIKLKIAVNKINKIYIPFILIVRNLVLGYGDFHSFKRRKELGKKTSR